MQIREIMRVLVYTILFLSSGALFGQQNNETINENTAPPVTNSTNNAPAFNYSLEELEEVELDTTALIAPKEEKIQIEQIQSKEIQAVPARAKSPKRFKKERSVKSAPVLDRREADELKMETLSEDVNVTTVESAKALEMKNVSSNFSNTYKISDTQRTSRSPSELQQIQMNQAVTYFEQNAPGSFESHYFKYVSGNYDTDLYSDLKAAEAIRPENSDVHVQMAGYFMIEDDADSALIYIDKLRESNRLTDNVIDYSGDILRSVSDEGALITHGFDDSYGTYYAQNSAGVRSDVTLISLDFLQSDTYKEELKEKGYDLPKSEVVDVDYLAEFCALNVDKNLSISLTTPKEYFQAIQDKLYVVGLVFEYHVDSFDNFSRNDYLWNNSMEKGVIMNPIDEKGKQLSANYLPMLLHLRRVYQITGEDEKMKEVDEVSDRVSVQCRKYEQVQKVKSSY